MFFMYHETFVLMHLLVLNVILCFIVSNHSYFIDFLVIHVIRRRCILWSTIINILLNFHAKMEARSNALIEFRTIELTEI